MQEPLDLIYFNWLCSKVCDDLNRARYSRLLEMLWGYEFTWIISGDDNRAEDCYDVRLEFFRDLRIHEHGGLLHEVGYSVLEVLIAFSRRASFLTDVQPDIWFWEMITNLGMNCFTNDQWPGDHVVDRILEIFVWRLYQPDGVGGLFPVKESDRDQREVEIWYQFNEYLIEQQH